MRFIGHLEQEAAARRFGDYLFAQGIDNQVEAEKEGAWAVWILAEEDLERAKQLLAGFRADPNDAAISKAAAAAEGLREEKRRDQRAYEQRVKQRRNLFRPMTAYGFGPLTFVLICACAIVAFYSRLGGNVDSIHSLFISEFDVTNLQIHEMFGGLVRRLSVGRELLPEVRHGEIWRLFTPALIHFGIAHIVFNMLWLRDLGSMIEGRQGSHVLAILVVALAVVSNVGQYLVSGPFFGGMSGVVYGLSGYIWLRGKFDPGSGLFLHPSTVSMMLIWYFLCLFGVVGGVANTVHTVGLVMGMVWGYLSSLKYR